MSAAAERQDGGAEQGFVRADSGPMSPSAGAELVHVPRADLAPARPRTPMPATTEGPGKRFGGLLPPSKEALALHQRELLTREIQLREQQERDQLFAEKQETRELASVVPDMSVTVLHYKSGAKTTTTVNVGDALTEAGDRNTTLIDTNPTGRLHERLGFRDSSKLVNTRQFAARVQGIQDDTAADLLTVIEGITGDPSSRTDKSPRAIAAKQAEVVAGRRANDVESLNRLRNSTQRGLGFIASSSTSLTGPEATQIIEGVNQISQYKIYDLGNSVGNGDGEVDIRNFINNADVLVFPVRVQTRETWISLADNFRRLTEMSKKLKPDEAEALRLKMKNSIIVISGLDPNMDMGDATMQFIQDTGLIVGEEIYSESAPNHSETKFWIGDFEFDGDIIGVPWEEQISKDVDFDPVAMRMQTQIANQRIANSILRTRYWQLDAQKKAAAAGTSI